MRRRRALGEEFGAHVAAGDGPLVVLFGEDRADEADDGVAVGEDPDDVGAASEFLVQPFLGVVRPDLPPVLFREPGEREDVGRGVREMRRPHPGTVRRVVQRRGRVGPTPTRVGLSEDRPHERRDHRLRGSWGPW